MKVRDLIHALTAEWIDQESEVAIVVGPGEFEAIEDIRTDQPWGVQRVFIETQAREIDHWRILWHMPQPERGTVDNGL